MIPLNDLSRSNDFDDTFFSDLQGIISSGQFLNGPHTKNLETALAQNLGVRFAVGVGSGTAALSLALRALNLPEHSGVILAANAGGYGRIALNQNSLKPVYVDVKSDGLLDLEAVETTLKSRASNIQALLVTHLYGQCHNLAHLRGLADAHQIKLIEDCAQSFGSQFEGNMAGSIGDMATFSFYPTKNLGGIGDSGAVVTSNSQLAEKIISLKQYGWKEKYSVKLHRGDNLRIDEIQALAVNTRLSKIKLKNSKRLDIWRQFNGEASMAGLKMIGSDSESFVAHLGVIDCGKFRDEIKNYFANLGIATDVHYPIPDHQQNAWIDKSISLPETERQSKSFISIPLFPEMTLGEIFHISKAIRDLRVINEQNH